MQDHYELDTVILKAANSFTLFRSDKASIELDRTLLAVSLRIADRRVGYVFLGRGKLLVDAIIETEEGAFGKSIQRELVEPFLMVGNTDDVSKHFGEAKHEDLKNVDIDEKTFLDKAQELINRFSRGKTVDGHWFSGSGLIFAFAGAEDRLDILLSKDSELVYTAKDMSFVSSGNRSVLRSSGQVVVSDHGRSIVVDVPHAPRGCC
jgi:hypothetical protein